jgi:adenylosuccinate lyase
MLGEALMESIYDELIKKFEKRLEKINFDKCFYPDQTAYIRGQIDMLKDIIKRLKVEKENI